MILKATENVMKQHVRYKDLRHFPFFIESLKIKGRDMGQKEGDRIGKDPRGKT